jgi:glycosyltransferase involved in cell wall biosynthesis
MVEAQACGTPVISYGRGGALDIVVTGPHAAPTGVLFEEQATGAIIDAVARFESLDPGISPQACRANAMRFSIGVFRKRLRDLVATALLDRGMACADGFTAELGAVAD